MARPTEAERFFQKVRKIPGSCWEWVATCTQGRDGGYGVFYAFDPKHGKKKNMPAHRWSYIYHLGAIPSGKIVMHICDNRKCVNPDHLRLGTLSDNARDMVEKNRWKGAVGEDHFNTQLFEKQIAEIRRRYAEGMIFQYELAAEYGVSQSTIGRIIRGDVWKRAPGRKGPGIPHRGERHHNAKLKTWQVEKIHQLWATGKYTQKALAEMFGICVKHVGEIVRKNKRKDE